MSTLQDANIRIWPEWLLALKDLLADMVNESRKLIPEGISEDGDHPAARNYQSKQAVLEKWK